MADNFEGTTAPATVARKTRVELRKEQSEIEMLTNTLRAVYHEITRRGPLSQHAANLTNVLHFAAERELLVTQKLEFLASLTRKITDSEIGSASTSESSSKSGGVVRETVIKNNVLIHLKYDITSWFTKAKELSAEFNASIQRAIAAIGNNDEDEAALWVKKGILANRFIEDLLDKILILERRLLKASEKAGKPSQS